MTVVAAHLIVGAQEEPFLPAVLAALDGVADVLLVNDNAPAADGPNARVLAASLFGERGRLIVDRSPFVDFAAARNRVLALHRAHVGEGWAAFVDADEVHHPIAAAVARNLSGLPPTVSAVDGYTRHFLQSFDWYTSIERRTSFFRWSPDLRWDGAVHERLQGLRGRRLAIPYVYEHYGYVTRAEQIAAKGRRYAGLGQAGATVPEGAPIDRFALLADFWPRALRFHGRHPLALAPVRVRLEAAGAVDPAFAAAAVRRAQPPPTRAANAVRRLNFALRWRGRGLDPAARRLLASGDEPARYEQRRSSQNGEDGILAELFRRLGEGGRFAVEFGASDGVECNAAALVRRGWEALLIEGDPATFARLGRTFADAPRARLVEAYVTAENVAALFAANGVPAEPDLLSVDIDGNDYWVWEALATYRPRVVVIEYNPTRPAPERWVMAYDAAHRWRGDGYYGASLASLAELGRRLGYALIGTERHGVNAFFVRDDLLARSRFPRRSALEAYRPSAYGQQATPGPFVAR